MMDQIDNATPNETAEELDKDVSLGPDGDSEIQTPKQEVTKIEVPMGEKVFFELPNGLKMEIHSLRTPIEELINHSARLLSWLKENAITPKKERSYYG